MRVAFAAVTGIFILGASAGAVARPATISDSKNFLKAVAAVRADAHNYDKFKEPTRSPLEGQSFKVVLPFDSDLSVHGSTSYDYKDGKLLLALELAKASPLVPLVPGRYSRVLLVAQHTRSLGSYVGQNAFGATARVHSIEDEGAGLALVATPRPMKQSETYGGATINTKSGWFYEQELPGSEAKAIALNAAVEIEGAYANMRWGDGGFCDFSGAEATISSPTDYYSEACYLGAKVTRIAFVNEVTGKVLREWTEASDPAVGAELWGGIRLGMDKYQVKALWPAMTDYGHIDVQGQAVSVTMDDDAVSSVEINLTRMDASTFAALNQKYGQPLSSKCIVETICSAKWTLGHGVAAYLEMGSRLTFQSADAPPPTGFSAD